MEQKTRSKSVGENFLYYLKRIKQLGLLNLIKRIQSRFHIKFYNFIWQQKALKFQANHTWNRIKTKNNINKDFGSFFLQLKEKVFVEKILSSNEFRSFSEKSEFSNLSTIQDWHLEFKNKKNFFYQDIKIDFPPNPDLKHFHPDIKNPWELSRFQHLVALGEIYKKTSDEKLAKIFQEQIANWILDNPFLLGVNWICPMEVAIRAINFIYGFHFFKNSKTISLSFWEKFLCSLYDHAKYLENNWETSDKPNNHYLSDLIGYFYLCFFLEDFKHFQTANEKTFLKLLKQFEKQVHQDGTCYEGSTNYHKLVTEIFLHFYILCKTNNMPIPENFYIKLEKMFLFLSNCTDQSGNLAQIGDNDSGKILCNIKTRYERQNILLSHYPNFGLTIIKDKNFHITFRHPTFLPTQPSGHFHQDALSITLSINGIQVLVDPGTYVYTPNATWRNFFRSIENHNTFCLNTPTIFGDLFQLKKTEQKDTSNILENENRIEIENFNNSYKDLGIIQHRKLIFLKHQGVLELEDWWEIKDYKSTHNSYWNLIFHPQISVEQINKNAWKIRFKKQDLVRIESNLEFKKVKGFYSNKYGILEECTKLLAIKKIDNQKNFIKLNATET